MVDVAAQLPIPELPQVHPALGRLVSAHHGRPTAGGWVIAAGGVCVLTALYQFVLGVSALIDGELDLQAWGGGALLLVFAALFGARAIWLWRQSVGIYEHGFVAHRLTGETVVAWRDIDQVKATRETDSLGSTFRIEIDLRSGATVELTDALAGIEGQSALFQGRGGGRG